MAGKNTLKSMFKEYFNIIGMVKKPQTPFFCAPIWRTKTAKITNKLF